MASPLAEHRETRNATLITELKLELDLGGELRHEKSHDTACSPLPRFAQYLPPR